MSEYYIKKMTRYKRHFICFECRKNFKQPNEKDIAEKNGDYSLLMNAFYYFKKKKEISKSTIDYLNTTYFENKILCPQCRKQMVEVPMSFETPPKRELKKWKSLKSFYL